jgi:sugar transport protein
LTVASGGYPFAFFSIMLVIQFLVVLFTFPKTKGITLEERQKNWESLMVGGASRFACADVLARQSRDTKSVSHGDRGGRTKATENGC